MLSLGNYFYLSLLVITFQFEQKTAKWKENLPETFDRSEGTGALPGSPPMPGHS